MKNKAAFRKLLAYLKPYRGRLITSIIMTIIYSFLSLLITFFVGKAIDLMVGVNQVDFKGILYYCIAIVASMCVIALFQYIVYVINNKMTFYIVRDLRRDINAKIHKLPLSYLDSNSLGDILNREISDVESISDGIIMGLNQLFGGIVTIITALVFMFVMNWMVAIVVVVLTPLSIVIAKFITKKTYKHFLRQSQVRGEETAFIEEIFTSQKVVEAFNQENQMVEQFDVINNKLEKVSTKANFYSSLVNPSSRLMLSFIYAGVTLTCSLLAIRGIITVGIIASFLSYVNQYAKPFNEITGVVAELQNAIASSSRVFDLLEQKEEDPKYTKEIEKVDTLTIEHADFAYEEGQTLITDLNLEIPQGTHVAIVGPTGCGKTTLINLLMRFYDVNKGSIKVDGVDIRDISRHNLRNNYGMVLQETWLMTASVRDNMLIAKQDATDEEIIKALKDAHCWHFVSQMEKGLDTIIKDDGALSQGQKQLLCVARLMLVNPPLLILDEATSSIDTRTEMKIQDAFQAVMKGKTSFVVAHRLSTIVNSDLILVMNKGNVIEKGTHEELLEKHGFYYELYNAQFNH
jgi:ATP-binding cassette subfamily B protein